MWREMRIRPSGKGETDPGRFRVGRTVRGGSDRRIDFEIVVWKKSLWAPVMEACQVRSGKLKDKLKFMTVRGRITIKMRMGDASV